jgi:hypothetical protein
LNFIIDSFLELFDYVFGSYSMSLLQRRRAKQAQKTNDFSTLTWSTLTKSVADAEVLVGKNAQIRYGIATETDVGLPENNYVLVPVTKHWENAAELSEMYKQEVLMCGIHAVTDKAGNTVIDDFPVNRKLADMAEVEWKNRTKLENIVLADDPKYNLGALQQSDLAATMTLICAHLNFVQLSADYPNINEGARIAGAHTIAMAYRTGILESHAGREFIFVEVVPSKAGGYRIIQLDPKYDARPNKPFRNGADVPDGSLRMHEKLVELGLGLCVGAGTTHYMMNHTTGGNTLNGHNLRALTINNLYVVDPAMTEPTEAEQTTFIYNVTHPVNKRAVANIVLQGSRVNCWHKNVYLQNPTVVYADTFMQYRQKLIPSGAHKIYVAAMVLRDIAQAGLAIFLPDQDIARKVIDLYERVLELGARAHIGSRYYTDEPPAINQGDIDDFMSLAAYYVQQKMTTSSLAASPHLSPEVADAAAAAWKTIVDATVRMGGAGAPIEQVTAYMKLTGTAGYRVDLTTEVGLQEAVTQNSAILQMVNTLFR